MPSRANRLLWIAMLLGAAVWVIDSVVDAVFFGERTIQQQLFEPSGIELYIRLSVFGLIVAFGLYGRRLVAEREHAESTKRTSDLRFHSLLANATIAVCELDQHGRVIRGHDPLRWLSDSGDDDQLIGRSFVDLIPEEDRPRVRGQMDQVRDGEPTGFELQIRSADGPCTIAWRLTPFASEETGADRTLCVGENITDSIRAEVEMRRRLKLEGMLYRELDHRVRNNLASLVTLIDLSARSAKSTEEFARMIGGRVTAMATVHAMLCNASTTSPSLAQLVSELTPDDLRRSLSLHGPEFDLAPRQVAPLGMLIHELITNSIKHGALSVDGGRIEIGWSLDADRDGAPMVRWHWRESGGPRILTEPERGVGTDLIEGLAHTDLRGEARLSFETDGPRHEFEFPCEPGVADGSVGVQDRGVVADGALSP